MRFIAAPLSGVWVVEPERISDERGFFARAWCRREFAEHGMDAEMVQGNTGYSHHSGTLRGLHWQKPPSEEFKLVRCIRGSIFDVVVDIRPDSDSYRRWFGTDLSQTNGAMMLIPPGFAHGYQTLEDASEIYYLTSQFYEPEAATGARFDDPDIGIDWPRDVTVISEQDSSWPRLGGDLESGTAREAR